MQPEEEIKTKTISIRIKPHLYSWLKENNYKFSEVFFNACKELGYNR